MPRGGDRHQLVEISGRFPTRSGDLEVFLDETGGETLTDSNRPMFGFGGCAAMTDSYAEQIASPWRALKKKHFGGKSLALHAADLKAPTHAQNEALGEFFRTQRFFRFAAIVTPSTTLENVTGVHDAAAYAIQSIIGRIVQANNPRRVVLSFEDSQRGRRLVMNDFGSLRMARVHPGGQRELIPIERVFVPKSLREPGIEVADFVAHTAGCQASNHERGDGGWRRDFQAVFQSVDPVLAHYARVTEMVRERVPLVPGREPRATYLDTGAETVGPSPGRDPIGTPHRPAPKRKI
jgi:hypothetical protein